MVLLLILLMPTFNSQNALAEPAKYTIPEYNSQIQIIPADGFSLFDGSSFKNNVWFFANQRFNNIDCGLSISAKNSSITITHYAPPLFMGGGDDGYWVGYFRYTVEGVGEQTFKIHHNWDIPINWHIKIDDEEKVEGDGWDYSDGWITVKNATVKVVLTPQIIPNIVEPSADVNNKPYFASKELNSSIGFADTIAFAKNWEFNPNDFHTPTGNGQPYVLLFKTTDNTDPTLIRCSWWSIPNIFYQNEGSSGSKELSFKARNSKVTITAFSNTQTKLSQEEKSTTYKIDNWLNYSVSGIGQQSIRLSRISNDKNLTVYVDCIAREKGDGWDIPSGQTENWLTVNDAKTSVSIHTEDTYTRGQFGYYFVFDYTPILLAVASIASFLIILLLIRRKRRFPKKITSIPQNTHVACLPIKKAHCCSLIEFKSCRKKC
jgi:hypothetical protein